MLGLDGSCGTDRLWGPDRVCGPDSQCGTGRTVGPNRQCGTGWSVQLGCEVAEVSKTLMVQPFQNPGNPALGLQEMSADVPGHLLLWKLLG